MSYYSNHKIYELDIAGKKVVWVGDGNNMCNSYINASGLLDFKLVITSPVGYKPQQKFVESSKADITIIDNPLEAVENADLIVTDVWASMGQEQEQNARIQKFKSYQVNQELMAKAKTDALFMHCLPAHRGEEVSAEVIDGKQSVVFQEAENRLHAQKALLEFLLV